MPVGAGGGAAFPGPRARRAGQRGSDWRARRAGRPRGRWGRRLSASGRAWAGSRDPVRGLRRAAGCAGLRRVWPLPASDPCLDFLLAPWESSAMAPGCGVPTLGTHVSLAPVGAHALREFREPS